MVTVPVYQQEVRERPIFQQGVDVRATPEAFGADIGRGLQQLGAGVDKVGDAVAQVKHIEDVTRAKDADNNYSNWARERMYGDGGFMTLQGKAAVDGRAAFEKEAEEKRKEFGQGLTPGAAFSYERASQARTQSIFQSSVVHTASERKSWFNDSSTARVKTFADDALVNFSDPAKVNKSLAAGILEIREQGKLQGWDTDTQNLRETEYVSGVRKNITLRIAQTDPIAADKYMKDNAGQMTGAHQYELQTGLKTEIKQEQSKRATSDFFAQSQPGGNDPAFSMIARHEGFRSAPYWDVNHLRTGYGSDTVTRADGSVATVDASSTVTEADAARDLKRRIGESQNKIVATVGEDRWNGLSAPARAAVTSVGYNYGTLPGAVADAVRTGGPAEIAAAIRGLENHNGGVNKSRRNQEADAVAGAGAAEGVGAVATGAGGGVIAAAQNAQSYFTNMEGYLSKITDPDVQDMTRRRINAALETQHKASTERERAAKASLWSYIDKGQTPDQVPMEVRQAAGMEAVSSAWGYMDTVRKGRDIKSDDEMLYGMKKAAAMDPELFSKVDLNDYRPYLSKADIKELSGLQTSALTDQRKAREEGLTLTSAFSQATQQLEAVGVTATGKKGQALEDANKRIAQFNNALASEMDTFKRENNNKPPTQLDIQSMVNKLLLPVVVKTPGALFGTNQWAPPGAGGGIFGSPKTFAFDASGRPDNSAVDVTVKYGDIPIDLRRGISIDLERELGRKAREEEIVSRYEDFVLNRSRPAAPAPKSAVVTAPPVPTSR